jgi:peptide chain release factor subunit 1
MSLTDQLARLAAFGPAPYPVVSLYLNAQPGPTGRDQFHTFVRKEFSARSRTYPVNSPERASLDRDLGKIGNYLETEIDPSANGVAIFACAAGELFEAVQLTAPIDQHSLYIGDQPHLYPLARIESQFPRYAAVLADTNTARIFVYATGELISEQEVKGMKTRRTSQGGWSQARYQRHIENFHLHHAKEVVEALERIVQQEAIDTILIAGDEVILPLLREQMPKHLSEKIVDHMKLDTYAPADEVLKTSLAAMKRVREQSEREKVEAAIGSYRAGGLGVVGPEDTLDALIKGQVDELLIASTVRELQGVAEGSAVQAAAAISGSGDEPLVATVAAGEAAEAAPETVRFADELITKATQTSSRITFVEDSSLLADYGGVAALLRFRI